jgi:hypothetical protein
MADFDDETIPLRPDQRMSASALVDVLKESSFILKHRGTSFFIPK